MAVWCMGSAHYASAVQVPLKRVNQAYVIATSTKVELKGSDVSKLEDSHFKAADKPREKKGEDGFFKKDTEPEEKVSCCIVALLMRSSRNNVLLYPILAGVGWFLLSKPHEPSSSRLLSGKSPWKAGAVCSCVCVQGPALL